VAERAFDFALVGAGRKRAISPASYVAAHVAVADLLLLVQQHCIARARALERRNTCLKSLLLDASDVVASTQLAPTACAVAAQPAAHQWRGAACVRLRASCRAHAADAEAATKGRDQIEDNGLRREARDHGVRPVMHRRASLLCLTDPVSEIVSTPRGID